MRCHPSRWLWGLIPVALLSWVAVHVEVSSIQEDLERRTGKILAAAGHDWAAIAFDGRDGLLVGQPASERQREEAVALIRKVWGVRAVRTRETAVAVAAAPRAPIVDVALTIAAPDAPPPAILDKNPPPVSEESAPPADVAEAPITPTDEVFAGAAEVEMGAAIAPPSPTQEALIAEPTLALPSEGAAAAAVVDIPVHEPVERAAEQQTPPPTTHGERSAEPATNLPQAAQRRFGTAALLPGNIDSPMTCADEVREAAQRAEVHFARGEAELDMQAKAVIDRLVAKLNACPDVALHIAGHADASGKSRNNRMLSERRARSVAGYMIDMGIDGGRLVAVGYGATRPLAPNDTVVNRARNRRIELEISVPPQPASIRKQGTRNGLSDR